MNIEITNLRKYESLLGLNNVVYQIFFDCSLTQNDITVKIGRVLNVSEPDVDNFVEYGNLTDEMVKGWITSLLTEEDINMINMMLEAKMQQTIERQNAPVISDGIPW